MVPSFIAGSVNIFRINEWGGVHSPGLQRTGVDTFPEGDPTSPSEYKDLVYL